MTTINWKKPVLVDHQTPAASMVPGRLADAAGLYFFSRRFGEGDYEPFYIGQSVHLRTRLEQYLLSTRKHEVRVRNVIEGGEDLYSRIRVANGPRYFHFGYLTPRPG